MKSEMVNRKYFQYISFLKQIYVSLKSYTYLMISFKFIHCLLPKQSKRSLSFTWKHNNMEMVNILAIDKNKTLICETLDNTGVKGRLQKCKFFILLGFNNNKVLLKYFQNPYSAQDELSNEILITTIQQLSQIRQVKTFLLPLIFGQTIE